MKRSHQLFWVWIFLLSSGVHHAQDECGATDDRKAEKLFEKGTNKKYSQGERIQYLRDAVETDEEYVNAWWELADIAAKNARFKGAGYKAAQPYLLEVEQRCPNFHSSLYYYLGQIAMEQGEYKAAVDYYQKFYDFDAEDNTKYDRRYDEYLAEVKENYKWAEFYYEQYGNPVAFNPKRVEQVSTDQDEYLPLITPDNEYMYFTRRFEKKNKNRGTYINSAKVDFIEEFSSASYTNPGFDRGNALPSPFNEEQDVNYGGATISIDNKELYLTLCKPEAGMVNCDIYFTQRVYGLNERTGKTEWYWSALENLGPNINTDDGWEAQPTLSKDGKLLIFATAREGSRGIDLYQSKRLSNGNWGPSEPLSDAINTDANDKTPFFHSDSKTLYFSSQGHLNHGGYDVFMSKLNSSGEWSTPKNLGYPINASGDEHGYVVSTDGTTVYFTSNSIEGSTKTSLNIYSFELYEAARPERVIMVKGKVDTKDVSSLKSTTVEIKNPETNEKETYKVDSINGNYTAMITVESKLDVPPPKLVVSLKNKEAAFESFIVDSDTTGKGFKVEKSLELKPVSVGTPYKINDIFYSTNSADLTEESKLILAEFSEWLKVHSSYTVAIHGHTDNVGDAGDNLALSSDRAFSVKQYLQSQGVDGKRLSFKGFGETQPIADNATQAGREKNRRTEFVIKKK